MSQTYELDIEEVEYLRHGDKPFMARIFKPRGQGSFPAVVEAHGGAWVDGHRAQNDAVNRPIAAGGVVVVALDFRAPPDATYPGSIADFHYAIRWLKANAARFNTRADMIGAMGTSSGGHIAVLAALKPHDPRYAAIPLPSAPGMDAKVPFVVTLWPVICPIGRFRDPTANPPDKVDGPARRQLRYWLTEAAMAEGSAVLALSRGDRVALPNIFYLQNAADPLHPRALLEQFVTNYRSRGGKVQVELIEGMPYDLVRSTPDAPAAKQSVSEIVGFIRRQTESQVAAA